MRRAAQSFLLMTATALVTSASAADSNVAPPANLRGTTAPAATAKQNIPVPVQTKEIGPAEVAKKPVPIKSAVVRQTAVKIAETKRVDVKHAVPKHADTKQVAQNHAGAKLKLTETKRNPVKHAAAKRTPVKRVAHFVPSHGIAVPLDEVRVVQFSQPITTVYVGNPAIADVSIIDPRHAFVLGKAFGETNMVALNADGKQVTNDHVSIFGHTGSMVTLHRGAMQMTYSCAALRCEAAPTPGDDKDSFTTRTGEAVAHQEWGLKSAGLASSDQQSHQ
jgi:Flp pilus assembly secretin CpaC